jgi:hypothetical protein
VIGGSLTRLATLPIHRLSDLKTRRAGFKPARPRILAAMGYYDIEVRKLIFDSLTFVIFAPSR